MALTQRAPARVKLRYRPSVGVPTASLVASGPVADALAGRLRLDDYEGLVALLLVAFQNSPPLPDTDPVAPGFYKNGDTLVIKL